MSGHGSAFRSIPVPARDGQLSFCRGCILFAYVFRDARILVRRPFPSEDAAAAKERRVVELPSDDFLEARTSDILLQLPGLIVEPLQGL